MNDFTNLLPGQSMLGTDVGLTEGSVPASFYTSVERFELERDHVFRRAWLAIARVEELPAPGDFLHRVIPPLRAKVILTRGEDGKVHAFHNACAHRGVALVSEERGHTSQFRCPYHAWIYGLDGKLRAVPGADLFPDVECGRDGLPPIHTDTWNGFIFVNFDAEPEDTLSEFLGSAGAMFGDLPFHKYQHELRMPQELATNWKHIANAFTEGYHLAFVHRDSLPFVFDRDNPLTHFRGIRLFGRHSANITGANGRWLPEKPVTKFALMAGLAADAELQPAGRCLMDHPAINPGGVSPIMEEAINIFPNSQIQVLANGYLWYSYWPYGPDRMLWDVRLYLDRAPHDFRTEFAEACYIAASRDVIIEDSSMTQLQQAGLESGGLERVRYGEHEVLLRHFAQAIQSCIDRPRSSSAAT